LFGWTRLGPKPFDTTQTWKQTSGDPSGLTWNYRGITLLYNFMTALLYMMCQSRWLELWQGC